MASQFNFFTRFEGGKELAKALRMISKDVRRVQSKRAIQELVKILGPAMKRRASVDTGAMKDSIPLTVNFAKIRQRRGEATFKLGPDKKAFYALFLEFGTINMAARPFMRPAIDAEGQKAVKAAIDVVWKAIQGMSKRAPKPRRTN